MAIGGKITKAWAYSVRKKFVDHYDQCEICRQAKAGDEDRPLCGEGKILYDDVKELRAKGYAV